MTTLIPALELELLEAARRTSPTCVSVDPLEPRRQTDRRVRMHRGFPLAALLIGSLTVSAGAYAARGLWLPELGADSYGHAVATAAPAPSDQASVLGVLRREQTEADRGAAARTVLRGAGPGIGQVRTNAVRKLGTLPDGRVAVLVPAYVPPGFDPTLPNMTRDQLLLGIYDPLTRETSGFLSSDALGMRAGNLMLPVIRRLSPSQRARSEAFLKSEVAAQRLRAFPEPPHYSVMSVEQTRRYDAAIGVSGQDRVSYVGVVPDGVARVRVDDDTVVPVKDNFFVAPSKIGSLQPTEWLDANGEVVPFASTLNAWK